MAYVEIDPEDFTKALRLLHSRTPESSDELKRLLDSYYVKQASYDAKKSSKDFTNVINVIQSLNQDINKNEVERRTRPSEDDSEATDIEDNENADANDFANDLGLACVVCKQIEITNNNQLFECQDCLCLYHQECHKPPITKKDINDPRLVWYCSKCSKNMKKVGKPTPASATKLLASKPSSSSLSLTSTSGPPSSSPYSITPYQGVSMKDAVTMKPQTTFLKVSESDAKSAPAPFKRAPGKFASFSPYSANVKPSAQPLSSTTRPSAATMLSANKGKVISSSTNNATSSFSAVNALPNLDKRFPNLKKAKLAKYNN